MRRSIAARSPDPIPSINTTPLIDVMLVLLIMMIMTLPLSTQKVPVDLPQGTPGAALQAEPHRLDITAAGALLWDGKGVSDAALPGLLATAKAASPDAELHLRTDPETRYERFDQVLAMVKRAGIERLGFLDQRPLLD